MMKKLQNKIKKMDKKNMACGIAIAVLTFAVLWLGVMQMNKAEALYDANGVKLCDYHVEKLDDGRVILHVESINEGFEVLACEISCTPDFNSTELFTFGALAQDGETSYTNEVITPQGDMLYIRALDENDNYSPVYLIDLTEDEDVIDAVELTGDETTTKNGSNDSENTEDGSEEEDSEEGSEENEEDDEEDSEEEDPEDLEDLEIIDETEETGYVYVNYVTTKGIRLATMEIKGKVGTLYVAESRRFEGYTFVEVQGNQSGEITKKAQNVTFVYAADETDELEEKEKGYVYVNYVSANGVHLAHSVEISGKVGLAYTTEELSFEGYKLVSVEGPTSGNLASETQYVVYTYEKTETEAPEVPEEPEHVHEFEMVRRSEATCTTNGYIKYACECGETYEETIEAHGHDFKVYEVTNENIEYHCATCGEVKIENFEDLTGNNAENDTENDAENDTEETEVTENVTEETEETTESDNDNTATNDNAATDADAAADAEDTVTTETTEENDNAETEITDSEMDSADAETEATQPAEDATVTDGNEGEEADDAEVYDPSVWDDIIVH